MTEEVKYELRYVIAEKIKRKWHTKVWTISKDLNLDSVYFFWGNRTFGKSLSDGGNPTNPVEDWDVTFRDGTELNDLQHRAIKILRSVNFKKYKNLKLRMRYDEVLGDIELELVNGAGGRLALYSRKAVTIMFRKGDVHDSLFSDADFEVKYKDKVDADFLEVSSYHNLSDLGIVVSGIETEESNGATIDCPVSFYRLLTDTPENMRKFVKTALAKQPSSVVEDLSVDEINDILEARGQKALPIYIDGLRFIGTGEPHLKLGDLTIAFSEEATNEAQLADAIFGKRRDLSKAISYHELYDYIQHQEGAYDSLSKSEKAKVIKSYKQQMRQLNYRIGSMLGLGKEKALTPVLDGIAINHLLLKPKN
ncbi:hypothetical protein IJ380_01400 [Candidatus Saccharibacteria bacterium]|nr:hypothetical protein [Candidatus Saccharibacteria bacterium]